MKTYIFFFCFLLPFLRSNVILLEIHSFVTTTQIQATIVSPSKCLLVSSLIDNTIILLNISNPIVNEPTLLSTITSNLTNISSLQLFSNENKLLFIGNNKDTSLQVLTIYDIQNNSNPKLIKTHQMNIKSKVLKVFCRDDECKFINILDSNECFRVLNLTNPSDFQEIQQFTEIMKMGGCHSMTQINDSLVAIANVSHSIIFNVSDLNNIFQYNVQKFSSPIQALSSNENSIFLITCENPWSGVLYLIYANNSFATITSNTGAITCDPDNIRKSLKA